MDPNEVQRQIAIVCDDIKDLLIQKNKAYGNSALNPKRIFSSCSPMEQLAVRIDDKLSRIKSLTDQPNVDVGDETLSQTKKDLIGYLVLELVGRNMEFDLTEQKDN